MFTPQSTSLKHPSHSTPLRAQLPHGWLSDSPSQRPLSHWVCDVHTAPVGAPAVYRHRPVLSWQPLVHMQSSLHPDPGGRSS